jgi:DNA-binding transcriptional LysR family regulator
MHQVRYFLAVAKHLNFTRAADEVRVAQPSLTRAIQKLEMELEGPLFRRERSKTHLTELGRMMLPHLQASHFAAENARNQARSLKRQNAGSLSLGICIEVDSDIPSRLVRQIVGELPALELFVEVASRSAVHSRLLSGEFDAAILVAVSATNERFDLHPIRQEQLVVVFGERHRLAGSATASLEALDEEPLITRIDCGVEEEIAAIMTARGLVRRVRHQSNDIHWTADFVRSGLGCAILPQSAAVAHGLAFARLEGVPLVHRTALAIVSGRRHSAALVALIRRVKLEGG